MTICWVTMKKKNLRKLSSQEDIEIQDQGQLKRGATIDTKIGIIDLQAEIDPKESIINTIEEEDHLSLLLLTPEEAMTVEIVGEGEVAEGVTIVVTLQVLHKIAVKIQGTKGIVIAIKETAIEEGAQVKSAIVITKVKGNYHLIWEVFTMVKLSKYKILASLYL